MIMVGNLFTKIWEYVMAILSNLALKQSQCLLSSEDSSSDFLINKLVAGDNVTISVQNDEEIGQQLVFSVNKKIVQTFDSDGAICKDAYLVLVDASKNHVKLTLPIASSFSGQLSIVCLDPTHGIDLCADSANTIFDDTSVVFNSKGDAITFISDGLRAESIPTPRNGTWYAVGRYTANWYA